MKKNLSIKKGMAMLFGSLLTVGLLVGGGSALKAEAAIAADESTNMSLGVKAISNPTVPTDSSSGFTGSYVYFGTNTYSEKEQALKFRVLQNEILNTSDKKDRLLLDCDTTLWSATKDDRNNGYITTQLNGTQFWNKCFDSVQKSAVIKNSYNSNTIFLLETATIMQSKYGYAKDDNTTQFSNLVAAALKKDGAYWLENNNGCVNGNGAYSLANAGQPASAGVSPALYLDTSKVLFTERVNGVNVTNGEYKLTLLDDSLKLTTTSGPAAGFDIDKDDYVTFPATLEGASASDKDVKIMVLVTDTTPTASSTGQERTDFTPSGSIVYYGNATYDNGNVKFAYNSAWDNKAIFLVAVKVKGGNFTDAASLPVYLGEGHRLISSIELEATIPLSDIENYKNNASDLPQASSVFTTGNVKITKVNDQEITNSNPSKIKITKVIDSDENINRAIQFNTEYNLGFEIQKNDPTDSYAFDANNLTVTIKYKVKNSDREYKTVTIKSGEKDSKENEKLNISGDMSESTSTPYNLTISGFTFTTRKARFINSNGGYFINTDTTIDYAASYEKVLEYLKGDKTSYTAEVPIEGGGKESVPITWDTEPHNTYKNNQFNDQGVKTFQVQGELAPSEDNKSRVEFPDETSKKVWLTVQMKNQIKVTVNCTDDGDTIADGKIKIGHRVKLTVSPENGTIYYTLNGSNPSNSSASVKNAETVNLEPTDAKTTTKTLKAYAVRGDDQDSELLEKTYTFATNTLTAVDAKTLSYNYGSEISSSAGTTGSDSGSSEEGDEADTTSTKQASVFWGATVTAKAEDKTSEGKIFTGWKVYKVESGTATNITDFAFKEGSASSQTIKFEMPNEELKIEATYEAVHEPTFTNDGQLQEAVVNDGEAANFSVALTYPSDKYNNSSFSYQWQVKASASAADTSYADISDANSKEYKLENVAYADSGKVYRCIVTYTSVVDNKQKKLTSDAATLTVKQISGKLQITKDLESSASVEEGKNITFAIEATPGYSDNTLSYQWYVVDNTTDLGTAIEGAIGSSYTISNATVADHNDKVYYCKVSEKKTDAKEALETKNSAKCTLTVSNKPSNNITITGGQATVGGESITSAQEGTTVTIKADTQENKKFTGWSISRADGEDISVEYASSQTTTFQMPASAVTITANFEDDYSITITDQPQSVSVPAGQSATFTVAANCYPTDAKLTYQWQKASGGSSTFENISGATEATYTVDSALQSLNGTRYQCVISFEDSAHADVSVTSDPALLSVEAAVYSIKVNDGTASVTSSKSGETITITANEAPEGQEFKKWTVVSGSASFADATATETTFTMPNKDVEITAEFQAKLAAPTITKQPESATVYAGSSTSFTIEATGEEMSYQWQVDKTDGKGFQNISGATNTSYRIYTEDGSMNGYKYKCVVSNRSASVESNTVTLTVNYKITEGANASWKKSSTTGLTFQGNGAYAKLRMVKVDGKLVGAGNYTKKSDPTIITLVASYLETLSTGEHTLTIVWEDGTAEAIFTVSDSSSTSNSGTSSSSSGSSSSKSSTSSSSSSSMSSTTDTTKKSSSSTGTADMPVVNRYKDNTATDTEKSAEETTAEETNGTETTETDDSGDMTTENGSVITTLDGDLDEKPSKLNQYAAAASIAVIGLSALGGISAFLIRKIRKQDEE